MTTLTKPVTRLVARMGLVVTLAPEGIYLRVRRTRQANAFLVPYEKAFLMGAALKAQFDTKPRKRKRKA